MLQVSPFWCPFDGQQEHYSKGSLQPLIAHRLSHCTAVEATAAEAEADPGRHTVNPDRAKSHKTGRAWWPRQTACALGRSGVWFRVGSMTSSNSALAGTGRARGCSQARRTTAAPKRATPSCHTLVSHPCSGADRTLSPKHAAEVAKKR